ncbi:phage tail protein [Sphingobium sp. AN558]|uniref:phage tail protein n=1 Tax=Sphingobium sp. AN558 TaxID=3133442 RepID=UPI0030BC4927
MGKFVGAIIGVVTTAVGVLTANPALIASGIGMIVTNAVALLFAPSMPTPDAAVTQKKESTPVRTKGYNRRRVYGKVVLFETDSGGAAIDVIAFLDGRSHAVVQPYLNDDKVTITDGVVDGLEDGRYKDRKVSAGFNLGLPTETAFSVVTARLSGIWTAEHRGDEVTSGYLLKLPVKDKDFLEVYPQGDNVVLSAVFDMQYLFDPRDETMDAYDPDTWVKAEPLLGNPALCLLHYLLTDRGVDYDTQIAPVLQYWVDAADHCDEPVSLKAGGTEPRYRCSVLYDMTAEPAQVIAEILKTFDGWYSQDELGRYIVFSGRFYEPTVTIGPSEIVNARHQGFVEDEDFYNELTVTYISSEHDYATVDTTPWRNEDDISERGKENSTPIAPQVPSHAQARRLAKRFMARQNAPDRGSITTNYGGMSVMGQRYIMLDHVEAGATFYSGPAEIITSPAKDMTTLGVSFDWVAANPNIDAWNPPTEEGDPAPVGDRVAPAPLSAPTISSALYYETGVSGSRVRLVADGPDRDDLTWYVRWKAIVDPIWVERQYSDLDPGPSVTIETEFLPDDVPIELEVAYQVGDGRVSPWSASTNMTIGSIRWDSSTFTFDSSVTTFDRN